MRTAFIYVTDERGFELAKHSAVSLALSQKQPADIHIFCHRFSLGDDIEFSKVLADIGARLVLHSIGDERLERHETHGHVTKPTLLKPLAVDRITDQYDRIVYLDNDILVFDDLSIADIRFGQAPMAAVVDMDLSDTGWLRKSRQPRAGDNSVAPDGYFNAGFMVFASENWRSDEFYRQYVDALDEHDKACPYKLHCTSVDQCAMNRIFEGKWIQLPFSYNMQAGGRHTAFWKSARVRHYCGPRKFIPVALFGNDGRDIRRLNEIRAAMGLSQTALPTFYEILFRLNAARKYQSAEPIRRYLSSAGCQAAVPAPQRHLAMSVSRSKV